MEEAIESSGPASLEPASKYVPIAELGRGGMATAFLTSTSGPGGFNKLMVVKRLRPALAAEADFLRMFLDEARLAARIDHPNIVHTSEVGHDGSNYFIAMEFVDGQPLENVIRRTKVRAVGKGAAPAELEAAPSVPLSLHLHILTKVLEGLDFAHELKDFDGTPLNVVHRDVSPHNVMITYDGHVKLLDFGIAKATDSTTDTRTGFMKGKCAYMAPEQFGGSRVDRRADLFSAGVMLWQAVTGRRLWRGLSDAEIFGHLAKSEVPSPRTIVADLDGKLEQICMKALATDPEKRYATAAELQSALEDYIAEKPELRASARDISRFMQELFVKERAKIQSLIETQVAKSRRSGDLMDLAEYFGHSGGTSRMENVSQSSSAVVPTRPASSRLTLLLVVAGALVCLIVGAVLLRRPAGATSNLPIATTTTSAPSAQLTVRVQPPTAKVTFDGVLLSGSPPTGEFTVDNGQHQVRVEAPGFSTRTEQLLLDSTRVTMDISLTRATATSAAAVETPPVNLPGPKGKYAQPWRPATVRPMSPPVAPAPTTSASVTQLPTPPSQPAPTARTIPTGPSLDKTDPWSQPKP